MSTVSERDYYAVLQIAETASHAEIKKAYRACAMACHPDRGGAPSRMRLVNEAWSILGDPASRREYDARRAAMRTGAQTATIVAPVPRRQPSRQSRNNELGKVARFVAFGLGRLVSVMLRVIRRMTR